MSEIKRALNIAPQTLYSSTRRLKELNLVYERVERGWPTKVYLCLTRQGIKLAESLSQANEIVGETIEALRRKLEGLNRRKRTRESKKEMVEVLRRLGEISWGHGEWNQALDYCTDCVQLAKELRDLDSEAKSNLILGEIRIRRGETDMALKHLKRSSELFLQLGDKENLSSVHYLLGTMSEEKGDYVRAISEYEKSGDYAEESDSQVSQGKAMLGMGRILGKKGQYEKSYRELMKAVRVLEEHGALDELPIAYANLGASVFFLDIEEAMNWFRKSIKMAEEAGNIRLEGWGWMNVAACLTERGQYEKALGYLTRALSRMEEIDEKGVLSSIHMLIGIVHREQGKWKDARESFGKAIFLAKEWDNPYHLADSLLNFALLDIATSSPTAAKRKLERARRIFKELENDHKVAEVQKYLDRIHKERHKKTIRPMLS